MAAKRLEQSIWNGLMILNKKEIKESDNIEDLRATALHYFRGASTSSITVGRFVDDGGSPKRVKKINRSKEKPLIHKQKMY